jgi:hypothetical protein
VTGVHIEDRTRDGSKASLTVDRWAQPSSATTYILDYIASVCVCVNMDEESKVQEEELAHAH